VPVEYVSFDSAGKTADAIRDAAVDAGFIANEPERANVIEFSSAYLELPATYLVPAGSPLRSLADVDRPGVRIAVSGRSAYDLYLSRTLKSAQLVRAEGIPASVKLFNEQKLDALAGLKPGLLAEAQKQPGSKVLDGHFHRRPAVDRRAEEERRRSEVPARVRSKTPSAPASSRSSWRSTASRGRCRAAGGLTSVQTVRARFSAPPSYQIAQASRRAQCGDPPSASSSMNGEVLARSCRARPCGRSSRADDDAG
jgi:hypothetical protein